MEDENRAEILEDILSIVKENAEYRGYLEGFSGGTLDFGKDSHEEISRQLAELAFPSKGIIGTVKYACAVGQNMGHTTANNFYARFIYAAEQSADQYTLFSLARLPRCEQDMGIPSHELVTSCAEEFLTALDAERSEPDRGRLREIAQGVAQKRSPQYVVDVLAHYDQMERVLPTTTGRLQDLWHVGQILAGIGLTRQEARDAINPYWTLDKRTLDLPFEEVMRVTKGACALVEKTYVSLRDRRAEHYREIGMNPNWGA